MAEWFKALTCNLAVPTSSSLPDRQPRWCCAVSGQPSCEFRFLTLIYSRVLHRGPKSPLRRTVVRKCWSQNLNFLPRRHNILNRNPNLHANFQRSSSNFEIIIEYYSGTPPYGHLVVTANTFFPGKTIIHFLVKKPVNAATSLIRPTATFWQSQPA